MCPTSQQRQHDPRLTRLPLHVITCITGPSQVHRVNDMTLDMFQA